MINSTEMTKKDFISRNTITWFLVLSSIMLFDVIFIQVVWSDELQENTAMLNLNNNTMNTTFITNSTIFETENKTRIDVAGEFLFLDINDFNKSSFLMVKNLNYSKYLNFTVLTTINFELNESINNTNSSKHWKINKSINSYSKTFGEVNMSDNFISFCVLIELLNAEDTNISNNHLCFLNDSYLSNSFEKANASENVTMIYFDENFTSDFNFINLNSSINNTNNTNNTNNMNIQINPNNISAFINDTNIQERIQTTNDSNTSQTLNKNVCSLSFETDKFIYETGESIFFKINASKEAFQKGIYYWIEISDETVVKAKLETKIDSAKKFTPKTSNNELYFLKGYVNGCNSTQENVVFFVGSTEEQKLQEEKTQNNSIISKNSFINIKEAYFVEQTFIIKIDGYRNTTNKRVVYVILDGENIKKEEQKFNASNKNSFFSFEKYFNLSYVNKTSEFSVKIEGIDAQSVIESYYLEIGDVSTSEFNKIEDSNKTYEETNRIYEKLLDSGNFSDLTNINKTKNEAGSIVVKQGQELNYTPVYAVIVSLGAYIIYVFVRHLIKKRKII